MNYHILFGVLHLVYPAFSKTGWSLSQQFKSTMSAGAMNKV